MNQAAGGGAPTFLEAGFSRLIIVFQARRIASPVTGPPSCLATPSCVAHAASSHHGRGQVPFRAPSTSDWCANSQSSRGPRRPRPPRQEMSGCRSGQESWEEMRPADSLMTSILPDERVPASTEIVSVRV